MRRVLGFFGHVATNTGMALASTAITSMTYSAGAYAHQKYESTKAPQSDSNQKKPEPIQRQTLPF